MTLRGHFFEGRFFLLFFFVFLFFFFTGVPLTRARRVSLAVTWLTVYRQLKIRELGEMGGSCSQLVFIKMLWLGKVCSIIHAFNFQFYMFSSFVLSCFIGL